MLTSLSIRTKSPFRMALGALSLLLVFTSMPACKKSGNTKKKKKKVKKVQKATTQATARKKTKVVKRKPAVARKKAPAKPKKIDFRKYLRKPPKGFVELKDFIPNIRLSIRYHTPRNFTEAPIPGYGAPGAWLRKEVAVDLAKVQKAVEKIGLGLLVYDAYRPRRASRGMVAWGLRTRKMHLFRQGYIAKRSGHNLGHHIDLTLVNLKTGKPLDMGTPWDTLNTTSHTRNAKGKALKNRLLLRKYMHRYGFINYRKEWWHFNYRNKRKIKNLRARDVPYACFEADEGKWRPPRGWAKPGFVMPTKWTPKPCK